MSLRVKFVCAFMTVAMIAVAVSAVSFLRLQEAALDAVEAEDAARLLDNIGRVASEAAFADDPLMLVDYLRFLLKTREDIAGFTIRRKDGIAPVRITAPGDEKGVRIHRGEWKGVRVDAALSKRYLDARREDARKRALRDLGKAIGVMTPVVLSLAVLLAMGFSRRLLALGRAVDDIGQGRFTVHTRVGGSDEIGKLASRIDTMAARLGELDEMKKTFVASVTHELRSPLAAIESVVKLLMNQPGAKSAVETELLQRVESNAARLGRFVTNMLEMAKIERGKLEFRPRHTRLQDVVQDVAVLFEPKAAQSGVRLSVAVDAAGPPSFRLDPDLITQVVANLLSNALKFTPRGGTVGLVVRQTRTGGAAWAECSVRDTGVGIPAKAQARLFVPFERVPNELRASGVGLGLAISKAIVEMHGGAIGVESSPGKGSCFWFKVPLK